MFMRPALIAVAFCYSAAASSQDVEVRVERDDFSPTTFYSAPRVQCSVEGLSECHYTTSLARLRDGQSVWRVALWAKYSYRWRFYNSISLVGGYHIPEANSKRTPLFCYRGSCDFLELVTFAIPDDLVPKDHSPLRVRFNSRDHGSFEGSIPPEHIEAIRTKTGSH